MVYRNKVYVCFDADEDMLAYQRLKAWKENENIEFDFNNAHELNPIRVFSEENIKRNLRARLQNTKLMIVLIGNKTKNLYKFVRWEMEFAIELDIPIIAVNLNKENGMDNTLCPPILKDKPIVHIPYKKDCIVHAMDNWVNHYRTAKQNGQVNLVYRHFDNMV